jgi:hypothetical protein
LPDLASLWAFGLGHCLFSLFFVVSFPSVLFADFVSCFAFCFAFSVLSAFSVLFLLLSCPLLSYRLRCFGN